MVVFCVNNHIILGVDNGQVCIGTYLNYSLPREKAEDPRWVFGHNPS